MAKHLSEKIEKAEKPRRFLTLLVVGPSRAGKSTFVNCLAQREVQKEGSKNTRDGCTKSIRVL